ncbi:hypothetical protein L210DRAFT_3588089 [Boletus edulis BED1]|uniref:Uncharacterized protein n=1 Tax=Boletus edulis BED1 TaxID=1328754 RepID=A0AAD4BAW0_BOLED|nr:hypothetical protein L210DRAFT_3588089 [Boletus edulis BED1]
MTGSIDLYGLLRSLFEDLVIIEEAFERLLLDDRVFSCLGVPTCLWRRIGEKTRETANTASWSASTGI